MRFVGLKKFGRAEANASVDHPNYFVPAIMDQWRKLMALEITPPWIPGLVQALVHGFVLILLSALAATFGTFNQIWETLFSLADEEAKRARSEAHAVAKSAHAATAGIFLVFGTPFFVLNAPFEAIGLLWSRAKGNGEVERSLYGRLVGVGALSVFAIFWRLGMLPYLGKGLAWTWAVTTGLGGPEIITNTSSELPSGP